MRGYKETSLLGCLSCSMLMHGGAAAAVAMISTASMLPESTLQADKTIVEFTVPPKGQQTFTPKVGPMKKVAQNTTEVKKVVIEKKVYTKPVEPAPLPAPKVVPAQKATPVAKPVKTTDGPSPVEIKQAQELMKQKAEMDALKAQQAETNKMLKQMQQQREADKAKAAALLAAQAKRKLMAEEQAQKKAQDLAKQNAELAHLKQEMLKQAAELKAAQNAAQQAQAAAQASKRASQAKSNLPFGVPNGTRNYQDLAQAPGNVPPVYPTRARLNKKEGHGRLMYYVNGNGTIGQMKLLKSSGHVELDQEAINKISKYRYRPGQAGWTYHDYIFSLKGQVQSHGGTLRR